MWEEDPRWQEANYRLLLWSVVVLGGVAVLASIFTGDWTFARGCFIGAAIILAALVIYAAVVWTVGHLIVLVVRFFRRRFDGHQKG
jgi:hypothetical protein